MTDDKNHYLPYDNYMLNFFNMWTSVAPTSSQIREQIWVRFSLFTSSEVYVKFWKSLHSAAKAQESPVLSFYVTYHYFIRVWESKYPTKASKQTIETSHLSFDEQNALWYVGGYILRKLIKKIKLSKNKNKEEMEAVIDNFVEKGDEDSIGVIDDDVEDGREWLNSINRGGLVKCTNDFYTFLRMIELEVKSIVSPESKHLGKPVEIATGISSKELIKDTWQKIANEELTPEDHQELMREIISLYVKVRFHAFAKKTMEQYKKENLKQIQKSKSFRSKLNVK